MYLNIKKKKIIGKVAGVIPGGSTVMKGVALKHRVSDVKTIYKTFRPTNDIKSNDIKSVAVRPQNNIQNNTQSVARINSPIPSPQETDNAIARVAQNSDERYNSQRARETNNPQPKMVTSEDRVKYQKYFKELGLDHETANLKDVSSAMRNLTKINHPDRGGDLYQQQKIGAAYNELKGLFH